MEVRRTVMEDTAVARKVYVGEYASQRNIADRCPKWCWILVGILGLLILIAGLLWGLGVFGGIGNINANGAGVAAASPNITANISGPSINGPNITGPTITAPNITVPSIVAPNITIPAFAAGAAGLAAGAGIAAVVLAPNATIPSGVSPVSISPVSNFNAPVIAPVAPNITVAPVAPSATFPLLSNTSVLPISVVPVSTNVIVPNIAVPVAPAANVTPASIGFNYVYNFTNSSNSSAPSLITSAPTTYVANYSAAPVAPVAPQSASIAPSSVSPVSTAPAATNASNSVFFLSTYNCSSSI